MTELKKVDGRSDGYKYIADVEYTMVMPKSSDDIYKERRAKQDGFEASLSMEVLRGFLGKKWEAGASRKSKGEFAFAKTEKGWKLIEQ